MLLLFYCCQQFLRTLYDKITDSVFITLFSGDLISSCTYISQNWDKQLLHMPLSRILYGLHPLLGKQQWTRAQGVCVVRYRLLLLLVFVLSYDQPACTHRCYEHQNQCADVAEFIAASKVASRHIQSQGMADLQLDTIEYIKPLRSKIYSPPMLQMCFESPRQTLEWY